MGAARPPVHKTDMASYDGTWVRNSGPANARTSAATLRPNSKWLLIQQTRAQAGAGLWQEPRRHDGRCRQPGFKAEPLPAKPAHIASQVRPFIPTTWCQLPGSDPKFKRPGCRAARTTTLASYPACPATTSLMARRTTYDPASPSSRDCAGLQRGQTRPSDPSTCVGNRRGRVCSARIIWQEPAGSGPAVVARPELTTFRRWACRKK